MPGRNRGKYWSVSVLKRRGWTNELIRDLLPAPHSFPSDGHPIRVWSKEDVRQAERSPSSPAAAWMPRPKQHSRPHDRRKEGLFRADPGMGPGGKKQRPAVAAGWALPQCYFGTAALQRQRGKACVLLRQQPGSASF